MTEQQQTKGKSLSSSSSNNMTTYIVGCLAIVVGLAFMLLSQQRPSGDPKYVENFDHPRVLDDFLPRSDVEYFKTKFKTIVEEEWERKEAIALAAGLPKPRRMLEYFSMLKHFHNTEPKDKEFIDIVNRMYDKVEEEFGSGYVMVNDFWSWRSPTNVAAEKAHMDADFWMADGLDGFNLWFLLDHNDMPYTFDVYTKEKNPELYKLVGLPYRSSWLLPDETNDAQKSKDCPGIIFDDPLALWPVLFEWDSSISRATGMMISIITMKWWTTTQNIAQKAKRVLPTWAFRILMYSTSWCTRLYPLPSTVQLETTRFPLNVGDALVVRQQEIHGTDKNPLQNGQYRLAIGFKFAKQANITCYSYTSPASKSRRLYPGLRMPLGTMMPDVYRTYDNSSNNNTSSSSSSVVDMKPFVEPTWMKALSAISSTRFTTSTMTSAATSSTTTTTSTA